MNSFERFLAFSKRQPIDRPLRYANFTPDLKQRLIEDAGTEDLESHFDMDRFVDIKLRQPNGYAAPDYSVYYEDLPEGTYIDKLGVARVPGSMYHFTHRVSPLRNATKLSELEEYPVLDYEGWDTSKMAREVEECHRQGNIASTGINHIYEFAWQVRGYEEFLTDMALQPEWCDVLLDKFTQRALNLARAAAQAGVEIIHCGDDVANQNALMFSPETWRKMMKPRWERVWSAARQINPEIQIFYHSDGNIFSIIEELREIGMTILNPLQPECMDLDRIAEKFRGRPFI